MLAIPVAAAKMTTNASLKSFSAFRRHSLPSTWRLPVHIDLTETATTPSTSIVQPTFRSILLEQVLSPPSLTPTPFDPTVEEVLPVVSIATSGLQWEELLHKWILIPLLAGAQNAESIVSGLATLTGAFETETRFMVLLGRSILQTAVGALCCRSLAADALEQVSRFVFVPLSVGCRS